MDRSLAVVIMAAGKGTRMNSPEMAKVMYEINGRPMIDYVIDLALMLQAKEVVAVVGWQKDLVIRHLESEAKDVVCVEQAPQLGTGHAVMQAESPLAGFAGDVLVLSGDVPLLSLHTTQALIEYHRSEQAAATVLTALLPDPGGYGRIIRDGDGGVTAIVEHKDATREQRAVKEVNSGIYVFDKGALFEGLRHIRPDNAQREYYLTDVFDYFRRQRLRVSAIPARRHEEVRGINTPEQLEEARIAISGRAL